MAYVSFSTEWLKKFSDPYAVLGISIAADERRIAKRYRDIAKQLHPDGQMAEDVERREFANQALSKLVNPNYQRLKQDKGRAESLATLRYNVRRDTRDRELEPKTPLATQLLNTPSAEADVFYEQAISKLAAQQYESLARLESRTYALAELNMVFLRVKMGDLIIRQKRTGLMASPQTQPLSSTSIVPPSQAASSVEEDIPEDYAKRHYDRAVIYAKAANWTLTIAELKDAIQLQPKRSQYHALLGTAYFHQKLMGMAKVHIRQALKLNPYESLARKYASQLDLTVEPLPADPTKSPPKAAPAKGSILGNFFARRS